MKPDTKIKTMRDASFMGIMRWAVWGRLKELGIPLHMTYGYKTAEKRKLYDLPKDHRIDARCISGHPDAKPSDEWFFCKKVRCHNRQIHKAKILKGGIHKRNQAEYEVKGFCLYDKVIFNGRKCFITGRRTSGSFMLKDIEWNKISDCAGYKRLRLIQRAGHTLIERRPA